MSRPLLEARGITRRYGARQVLHGIDLEVAAGETLGLIGESGSGKSTLSRILLALDPPTEGLVRFDGITLTPPPKRDAMRAVRRQVQAVFQDPYGSLNPRHSVGRIVAEPLLALRDTDAAERRRRVLRALEEVGLSAAQASLAPHQFSGGQRQRIAIARALVTRPRLVIADEPVSALDVSVRAQVLNLMLELRARHGLAYLFVSHDLAVVRHMAHRVAVLYRGRIVEQGPAAAVLDAPRHPYTAGLTGHVPATEPEREALTGVAAGTGCPFARDCPAAQPDCRQQAPRLRILAPDHRVACHHA